MGQVLLAEEDAVSRPAIHVNAGQRVQLRVDPVQTAVGHVWGEERAVKPSAFGSVTISCWRPAYRG